MTSIIGGLYDNGVQDTFTCTEFCNAFLNINQNILKVIGEGVQGFPQEIDEWGGGILTTGYCSRTIDYCFPIVFQKFLWGDKALMEGTKS